MKKIKVMIPYLIISIILIVGMLIKVYADYLYSSSDVEYDNSNSSLEANDVQGAIDELYEKAESCASSSSSDCPEGYEKENLDNGFDFKCVFSNKPICKRATTLHTETCSRSSNGCYADGYYASGSKGTTTITYGSLGTSGTLTSGDAFDCDVNGDGTYDAETERFYYVSDYYDTQSKTVNNDYAVLIYFSNIYNGKVDASHSVYWTSNQYLSAGPIEARYYLPTISQWRDDLLKTRTRNIFGVRDVTQSDIMNPSSKLSDFSYEGYAARLLTLQELYNGCYDGVTDITTSAGIKSKCQFLLEKTRYSTSSYATYGSWLETVAIIGNNSNSDAWQVNGYLSHGTANSTSYVGTRPVIEVAKTDISY